MVDFWRSSFRPKYFLLMIVAVLLAACSGGIIGTNNNWPGLSAADGVVYMAYGNNIVAVDAETEREVWRFPEGNSSAPILAPPSVDGNIVYAADYGASQGFFSPGVLAGAYALDAANLNAGVPAEVWYNERVARDRIVAAPLAVDGRVFIGSADNLVIALDESTGEEIWSAEMGHSIWGQPAYANGVVYVTSLDKTIRAFDASNGSELWSNTVSGAVPSSPLIVDDSIYVTGFDAQLHAFDLDGNERWKVDATDWVWNSPAYTDGKLFFGDVKGNVYGVDAASGNVVWEITVNGSVEAGLAVSDGIVFIPSLIGVSTGDQTGELLAVSAADGDQIWRKELATPIFTTPVVESGRLIALFTNTGDNDIELRFYDPTTGNEEAIFVPQ